jgi:Uma2 family endonuclease
MATEIEPVIEIPPPQNQRGWKPYRLPVNQFLKMVDAGIFPHDAHVELLGGILIQMMTKGDPHDFTLGAIGEALRAITPEGWILREDKSLQLGRYSRPEPDVAIVRGPRRQYSQRTPHARETALVVEVAQSTYPFDRGEKWRAYAASRIPIYWIVNLDKSRIEVYRAPAGRGKTASYHQAEIFEAHAEIPVVIEGHDVGRVVVRDVLP